MNNHKEPFEDRIKGRFARRKGAALTWSGY